VPIRLAKLLGPPVATRVSLVRHCCSNTLCTLHSADCFVAGAGTLCCVAHSRPPAIDCGRRRTTSTGAVMHEAEQSPIDTWTKNTQPTDCFLWPARRCKAVMPVPADQSICWSCSCVLCPCCPCFSDSAGGWETADEARRLVGRLCTRCARRGGTVGSCARWAAACPRRRPLAPTPAQPTAASVGAA